MSENLALSTADFLELLVDARQRTLALTDDLHDEQMTVPHTQVVNPFLWELGHVGFFYDVFVLQHLDGTPFSLDRAERLYDSFRVNHEDRWSLPLPSRPQTLAYMEQVLERTQTRLEKTRDGGLNGNERYCLFLAILHEDMHCEAFTYMRQTLGYPAPRVGTNGDGQAASTPPAAELGPLPGDVEIPGGKFILGAHPEQPFVFDNEKWGHEVELAPFRMARAPVTNREFLEFVEDRGYFQEELWSYGGWTWRSKHSLSKPVYWSRGDAGWLRRDFDRWVPLEDHRPVCFVSWYEAEAYCNWARRRLPTEAEWELAASSTSDGSAKHLYPWGDGDFDGRHVSLDSRHLGCVDVAAHPEGDSGLGCRQMLGNVWEWTATDFYPYPGFIVDRPYLQYSAPWFGYRKVLKGGCWATRDRLANNTYRNYFEPFRQDVIAGFRTCAR